LEPNKICEWPKGKQRKRVALQLVCTADLEVEMLYDGDLLRGGRIVFVMEEVV
jgi:hypothetical protein